MFKFLNKNRIEAEWHKVSDLKVGMQIAVPKDYILGMHQMGTLGDISSTKHDDDILWDEIESIEYVGTEQVWDIEVEGTHNFVGNNIFAHNTYLQGNLGVGINPASAQITIGAGTATAGTAPLKFTSGALNTTAEAGAMEFLTDAFYGTITTGAVRKQFAFTDSAITSSMYIGTTAVALNRASAALTLAGITLTTPDIGTPSAGVLTNATGLPSASVLAGTFGTGAYVMDTSLTTPKIIGGTATTSDLFLQTTSGVGATGADMHFLVGNNGATEAMTILNDGNVGIGTTGPGAQLHLYKSVNSLTSSLIIENANPSGATGDVSLALKTRSSNFGLFANDDTNMFGIVDYSLSWPTSSRLLIDANGNIGIGTASPLSKLSINGGLHVGGDSDAGDNNLLVDGNITSSGGITAGLGSFNISSQTDIATTVSSTSSNILAYAPFGSSLWHDKLRFSTESGTPTFETYNGSWSAGTLDAGLFAGQDAHDVQQIDGTTVTAARWTWNDSTFAYGQTFWWLIGVTYTATASNKNFLIESSPDGITWTTRHTSTGNTANSQPVILYTANTSTQNYMRLTITVTNSQPLKLSSIQALSNRTGGQFMGKETIYPYTWDSSKNTFFSGNVGVGTTAPTGTLDVSLSNNSGSSATAPFVKVRNTLATQGNGSTTFNYSGIETATGNALVRATLTSNYDTSYSGGSVGTITNYPFRFTINSAEVMRINTSGNLGIGAASPSYKLQVGSASVSGIVARFENSTGTCDINPTTSTLSCSSDINLKKNIVTLNDQEFALQTIPDLTSENTLSKIMNLTPVRYNWSTEKDTDSKHIGFIAQEMEQIFPDLVATDPLTGLKSISYANITPYLVKSVQEMNLMITDINNFKPEDILNDTNPWRVALTSWLGNATNKITRIFTGEICLTDESGETECINRTELKSLKTLINTSGTASVVSPTVAEPIPTEPAPVEPIPTDPTVVEPAPTEPTIVEPTPTDPVVVEPTIVEPTPTDPVVVEPTIVESTTTEPVVEPTV